MKTTMRPYTAEEVQLLKSRKYSLWQQFENFGMKWIIIAFGLLFPFILYEKFVDSVSSEIQLITSIFILIISIGIVLYWMNKEGELSWNKKVEHEIKYGKAQVMKIETEKVIKRRENYDLGSGFYIQIAENKTLYLQGPYYDTLQSVRKFPNTDFEIVTSSLMPNELIIVNTFGTYINPQKLLKPFTKAQFESNKIHQDGEILNIPIDDIK